MILGGIVKFKYYNLKRACICRQTYKELRSIFFEFLSFIRTITLEDIILGIPIYFMCRLGYKFLNKKIDSTYEFLNKKLDSTYEHIINYCKKIWENCIIDRKLDHVNYAVTHDGDHLVTHDGDRIVFNM